VTTHTVQSIPDRAYLLDNILPKHGRCVEVGVLRGDFSREILDHSEPAALWLVDPWADAPLWEFESNYNNMLYVQRRFAREISDGQVRLVRAASVEAAEQFADESLDWVYLDGNHSLHYVTGDILAWLPKIPIGAILAGHDYRQGDGFGVIEAVRNAEEDGLIELFAVTENVKEALSFAASRRT
jgi:hypothetical protein